MSRKTKVPVKSTRWKCRVCDKIIESGEVHEHGMLPLDSDKALALQEGRPVKTHGMYGFIGIEDVKMEDIISGAP